MSKKDVARVWVPSLCSGVPPLRVGRFPVFLPWRLLCLLSFLAFSCPSGFFLLSVGVVVLSVLSGAVGRCLSGVALLLCLCCRCVTLGRCVAFTGVRFLPALPSLPSGGGGLFFFCLKGGELSERSK